MKSILYILLGVCMAMTGCSKSDYSGYDADNYIYFSQDTSSITTFSFFFAQGDEGVVKLPLEIIAPVIGDEREYKIGFVKDESSAVNGDDFIMPEGKLVFGGNLVTDTLQIKVLRPKSENHEAMAVFELLPSSDFLPGMPDRVKAKVVITNKISQPTWWDQWHLTSGLGAYSDLKYKAFYDCTGVSDLDYKNREDLSQSEVRALILEFKYWLKENPRQDVNGPMDVAMKG